MYQSNKLLQFINKYQHIFVIVSFYLLLIRYMFLLFQQSIFTTFILGTLHSAHIILLIIIFFTRNKSPSTKILSLDITIITVIFLINPDFHLTIIPTIVHALFFYLFFLYTVRGYLIYTIYLLLLTIINQLFYHSSRPFEHMDLVMLTTIIIFYLLLFLVITRVRKDSNMITKLAFFDQLTTLPNRRYFYKEIENSFQLAHKKNTLLSLLYLDLDGFKLINDTLGHKYGDQLLHGVAKQLKNVLDNRSFLARIGGDEFVVIISNSSQEEVTQIAEQIRFTLEKPFQLEQHEGHISTSIGISHFPSDASTVDELIKHADSAMYEAKKSGKNQIKIYK